MDVRIYESMSDRELMAEMEKIKGNLKMIKEILELRKKGNNSEKTISSPSPVKAIQKNIVNEEVKPFYKDMKNLILQEKSFDVVGEEFMDNDALVGRVVRNDFSLYVKLPEDKKRKKEIILNILSAEDSECIISHIPTDALTRDLIMDAVLVRREILNELHLLGIDVKPYVEHLCVSKTLIPSLIDFLRENKLDQFVRANKEILLKSLTWTPKVFEVIDEELFYDEDFVVSALSKSKGSFVDRVLSDSTKYGIGNSKEFWIKLIKMSNPINVEKYLKFIPENLTKNEQVVETLLLGLKDKLNPQLLEKFDMGFINSVHFIAKIASTIDYTQKWIKNIPNEYLQDKEVAFGLLSNEKFVGNVFYHQKYRNIFDTVINALLKDDELTIKYIEDKLTRLHSRVLGEPYERIFLALLSLRSDEDPVKVIALKKIDEVKEWCS